MSLLSVPGAAPRRTQPIHHRDQVEQPRARDVIGPDEDLHLRRILTTADLGLQRIGQAWVAIRRADPGQLTVAGTRDQQASKNSRLLLAQVSDRNTRLLYRL